MDALAYDPFQGDFGSQGDRVLTDRIVKASKPHECSHCNGPIQRGEHHRSRTDIADGDLMSWRWCAACCAAMVAEMDGQDACDPNFPFGSARCAVPGA
jgi:hypothetical protein